jgi:hypothetical protein
VCADSGHIECLGHGTLRGTTIVDGQASNIMMRDIAYIPGASHTLISPQQLLDAGCQVTFNQQCGFLFYLDDKLRLFSYRSGNLYYFNITFTPADIATPHAALVAAASPLCLDLIHRRLGHVSERRCREFIQQSADLSEREKCVALSSLLSPICDICLAGKQTVRGVSRVPCTNHSMRGAYPSDLLSLDLIGPMRHQSASGHAYLLTVTNSYSRMHFVRPLPNKTSTAIRAALQAIAASFPPAVRIHRVRLDNAHKLNALVGAWILDISAKREPTPPYTSEYNGVIEWFNHEVMTRVQCLLFDARLPSEWWAEAARYACDIINLTPTRANPDSASPYMLWNGIAPPSRHIRVFGAPGWMRLHAHEQHKISKQSVPVRFMSVVDYSLSTYRVYIVGQRRVVDMCNVVFDECCASRPPDDHPPPTHICVPLLPDDNNNTPATLSSLILGGDAIANTPADSTETVLTHELPSPDLASPDCPMPMASGAVASVSPPAPSDIGPAGPVSHMATALATAMPLECTPTSMQIIGSARGSTTTSSKQIEWAAAASAKYGGETVAVT